MTDGMVDVTKLGELAVYDESGTATTFASLWDTNSAVLVFIRHFG